MSLPRLPPSSDATSRPRSRSGILTPASESSVNRPKSDALPSTSQKRKCDQPMPEPPRKRKRDGASLPMDDLLKAPVTIKPHPPNLLAKPHSLLPLMLLPREHLPLSCLDLSAPHGELPAGRFHESRIRILELEGRLGSNMLIARSNSAVYAVEREQTGLYVVCKLGSWVQLEKLSQHATTVCQQRMRRSASLATGIGASEPPLVTPQMYHESKRKRLAIEEIQSIVRRRQGAQSAANVANPEQQPCSHQPSAPAEDASYPQPVAESATAHALETPAAAAPSRSPANADALTEQQTGQDIFQNIRTQYFEALYRSMGSLAYFAKGPLSRARAAFHLDCDSNLEMKDLIDFLTSLALTTTILDKKYRETIPDIIAQMRTLVEDSNGDSRPKKKKARKMKLGRNGLYPTEDDYVMAWWKANKPELRDDEVTVKPEEVKFHIARLRTRETELQMILLLEILALETIRPNEDGAESQLPGMELASPAKRLAFGAAANKKGRHTIPVLIDVHADRLCIWQSTTTDDVKALAESQMRQDEAQTPAKSNSDPLKDFCVDIVNPFFSARLPALCDTLNKKLGGPISVSPPKSKATQSSRSASKSRPKPGSSLKRPTTLKASQSLESVLSRERLRRSLSRAPSDVIAQMRKVTLAPIPGLKRELSEPRSLKGIPTRDPASLEERPVNVLSRSSSMTASSTGSKAKKAARVEAELRDAISALKKPNRELAGREIVHEAERRLFGGPTLIRKSRKVAQSRPDRVQVKATPVNNRYRDALAAESQDDAGYELPQAHGPDFVPSSGLGRSRFLQPTSPRVTSTPLAEKVQATPARPSAVPGRLLKPPVPDEFVPTSSPLQSRKSAPAPAPALLEDTRPATTHLFETPVKRRANPTKVEVSIVEDSPATGATGSRGQLTIYERLGWDDEDLDGLG